MLELLVEDLVWMEAEQVLGPDTVVLIPLGAAALEHGPHLKLRTEAVLTGHFTRRVASATQVVVAPMLTYHYYPGFGDFPGTASLSLDTARNLTIDLVRSLAKHGPRRFYVLTGAEWSHPALAASAEALVREGILLRFTDVSAHLDPVIRTMQQQELQLPTDLISGGRRSVSAPARCGRRAPSVRRNGTPPTTIRIPEQFP